MNNYQIHKDIVLEKICGTWMLVALASAQKDVPYTRQINETGAFIWKQLNEGSDLSTIKERLRQEYPNADPELINADVDSYIALLKKNRYII